MADVHAAEKGRRDATGRDESSLIPEPCASSKQSLACPNRGDEVLNSCAQSVQIGRANAASCRSDKSLWLSRLAAGSDNSASLHSKREIVEIRLPRCGTWWSERGYAPVTDDSTRHDWLRKDGK